MQSDKEKLKNKDSKISQQNHIIEEFYENGDIQYNCTACRKIFRSRSQKYYHLNCNQLENKLYKCEHCDKSFARLSQWKYHVESHLSPVNECQKCQKIFSNPLALKKHVALHNVELKLCPHCDKTFKKKISLDHHIAAQHLNQLQYGCAYCSKKYASKSSLQLHLQTHEEKRFECTVCGKLFQRNSILNQHLKRHYNTSNYICTVCQKVFSESGALARHRKTHEENIIRYHCKLCDKNILRKDNMTRHLNTIHPEENFENTVDIIKAPMKMSSQAILESEESVIKAIEEENQTKIDKNIVIIENKLLQKPFELKGSINDLPQSITNKIESKIGYPPINQIKVITAVPTYKQEIFTKDQEIRSKILENSKDSGKCSTSQVATTCYLNQMQYDSQEQIKNNSYKSFNQTEEQNQISFTTEKDFNTTDTATAVLNPTQSIINYELPKTQTISSVIRSIGNVKKNLTPHMVTPTKPINKTFLEYKHKKYCRNNYNIDLYRKILGCDDGDGDEAEQDKEQQQNSDHLQMEENLLKSSTPVHWRKSFKNNYEISSS